MLSRGFLWLKKSKTLGHGHFISDLNGEEIIGTIYGKELQKTNQKEFRVEKVINYILNGRAMVILLIAG